MNLTVLSWAVPGALLVLLTVCGFLTMRPESGDRVRRLFWTAMVGFFITLIWPMYRTAPAMCWVPLIPAFMFARVFILLERALKKETEQTKKENQS